MTVRAIFRLSTAGIILACGLTNAAQENQPPPKELVQYVREARQLGLKESQIQLKAIEAGWPSGMVNEAIKSVQLLNTPKSLAASLPSSPSGSNSPTPTGQGSPSDPHPVAPGIQAFPPATKPQDTPPSRGVANTYQIGAGDVLQIVVWKEPEASVDKTVVRPDGMVTMPILKEIEIVGMTPSEAEKMIAERLAEYIPGANVTVVVAGINSKKIYVIGGVKKEGPIAYTYRMTVMQALSEAGGLSDYAKRKKIYVLRTENGKEYRLPFDYDAVLRGERMELNISLLPSDTLVVPR